MKRIILLPLLFSLLSFTHSKTSTPGIRDDIQKIINKLKLNKKEKKATIQLAKSMQNILDLDLKNEKDLRKSRSETMRSIVCLIDTFEEHERADNVRKRIRKITFNTKERVLFYAKYNSAQSGSVTRLINEGACDE